jgi:hypothetical protein
MWNDETGYLQWLYLAYEQFKTAKYVYDKKGTYLFYNKPYWDRRFKMEIERMEQKLKVEEILTSKGNAIVL